MITSKTTEELIAKYGDQLVAAVKDGGDKVTINVSADIKKYWRKGWSMSRPTQAIVVPAILQALEYVSIPNEDIETTIRLYLAGHFNLRDIRKV